MEVKEKYFLSKRWGEAQFPYLIGHNKTSGLWIPASAGMTIECECLSFLMTIECECLSFLMTIECKCLSFLHLLSQV